MINIKNNNHLQRAPTHPDTIKGGWLVLGFFLLALLATPFLANNADRFSGKAVTTDKITEKYFPTDFPNVDDDMFYNLITTLGNRDKADAFMKCIEQKGRVTFDRQTTHVTGKGSKPKEYQTIYYPGCVGDNLVTYSCIKYKNYQYSPTGIALGEKIKDTTEEDYDDSDNDARNTNLRSDGDKMLSDQISAFRLGPSQITKTCPNGCKANACI